MLCRLRTCKIGKICKLVEWNDRSQCMSCNQGVKFLFLGGLSLHLNHLIAYRLGNYDWQFGTLPFGLFWSNLDTMDLETYPRTYCGQF